MNDANTSQPVDILKLIENGEGQRVEFKKDFPEQAEKLAKSIAAFATCNGGHILIGVITDGSVVGLNQTSLETTASWKDEIQRRIQGISEKITPKIRVDVTFITIDGEIIIDIFVPKGGEPQYYVGNIPYLRDLSVSRPAKPEEVKDSHLKHFEHLFTVSPAKEKLFALLGQLSDLTLILSDVKELRGDDLKQWKYDLGTTANMLLELSNDSSVTLIGAKEEVRKIAYEIQSILSIKLYLDGGVSYNFLLNGCREISHQATALKFRLIKNLPSDKSHLNKYLEDVRGHFEVLRDVWKKGLQNPQNNNLEQFRNVIRMNSFGFSRVAALLHVNGDSVRGDAVGDMAIILRSIDKDRIFHPGIGTNPWNQMTKPMAELIKIAEEKLYQEE